MPCADGAVDESLELVAGSLSKERRRLLLEGGASRRGLGTMAGLEATDEELNAGWVWAGKVARFRLSEKLLLDTVPHVEPVWVDTTVWADA